MLRRAAADDRPRRSAERTRTVTLQLSIGHAGLTLEDDVELQAVVVSHCHPRDLAARSGIAPGDVIVALDDNPIKSHEDAIAHIDRATTRRDNLSITFMPSTIACEEREARAQSGPTRAQKIKWAAFNVAALLGMFYFLRPVEDPSMAALLDQQNVALDQMQSRLTTELFKVGQQATWLAERPEILARLRDSHPAELVQLMRVSLVLDQLMVITNLTAGGVVRRDHAAAAEAQPTDGGEQARAKTASRYGFLGESESSQ